VVELAIPPFDTIAIEVCIMPCYLFTFHAYGTWMPDREEGFVRRKQGVLPPDEELAKQYRDREKEDEVIFGESLQRLLIEESRVASEKQRYRVHYLATEPTHLHALVSWPDDRPALTIRTGLKSSLTRRLNCDVNRRDKWFVENASRKQVKDDDHFGHLVNSYLPSHRGWKWREGGELFR
jgi:REP element-mobilizing transposase RayT